MFYTRHNLENIGKYNLHIGCLILDIDRIKARNTEIDISDYFQELQTYDYREISIL